MKNLIMNFFHHTFKITSNPIEAKVTYIVDCYDRTKDISCTTPCKITLPWEPILEKRKKKILIEKDGYETTIITLKPPLKAFLKLIILFFFLGIICAFLNISEMVFILIFIVLLSNISIGSDDINVTLQKKE